MRTDLYERFLEREKAEREAEKEKNNSIDTAEQEILIDIDLLDEFNNHIFSGISEKKFEELKESISRFGLFDSIIVRKKQDRYEIISGHNRVKCCKELGKKQIKAKVKEYDDDMAELAMIETNLTQRENILPCEKGLAYKKQLELIKKINKENDIKANSINGLEENVPVGHQDKSVEQLANESEDSITQIKRFIRLTELNNELKNKVNNGIIGIRAGVELSYIKPEEQVIVNDIIDEKNIELTTEQARKLREVYGTITKENVLEIIKGKQKKKEDKFTGKLLKNTYKKYKEKFANDKEFSELIEFLLEKYYKNLSDKRRTILRFVIHVESSAFKLLKDVCRTSILALRGLEKLKGGFN